MVLNAINLPDSVATFYFKPPSRTYRHFYTQPPQFVDFTIDASNVYFSLLGKNVINKVPLGGGTISAVQQLAEPWVLINDASHLYWIDLLSNGIMETTKTTVPGTLATSLPGTLWFDPLIAFEGLSIDSGGLYVTETQTGNIYRLY